MSDDTPPASACAAGDSSAATRPVSRRKFSTVWGSKTAFSGKDAARGEGDSGRKALQHPFTRGLSFGRASVPQPVVQAVGAALPGLDRVRHGAIAAPLRRARRTAGEARLGLLEAPLERGAVGHGLALWRGPGGEPSAERTRREVGIGGLRRYLLDTAFDAHLPLELGPEKHEAGGAGRIELAPLAARVVRVEHERA